MIIFCFNKCNRFNYKGRFNSKLWTYDSQIYFRNIFLGRWNFQRSRETFERTRSFRNYTIALGLVALGCSFAAVPLYRIFCQSTGYGGTVRHDTEGKIENLKKKLHRPIKVKFNSDVGESMMWKFKPQQSEVLVFPGETALAFYTATNPTDKPIIGVSTYNVLPYAAARYFNKIQCFCFEEQYLNPKEQVDMPVFFYIDPEFCEDPQLEFVKEVILSYTFFEAKKGLPLFESPKQ